MVSALPSKAAYKEVVYFNSCDAAKRIEKLDKEEDKRKNLLALKYRMVCHLLHLINSHAKIQRVRLYAAIKRKCAWIWVCVRIRQLKNVQKLWSTSPQTKYKQLTWASFNLIDIVLKNNTAYFGCSASKLTVTFSCLTFCQGGLQLWKGAWWKTLKKKRQKWNKRRPPTGTRTGAS